MPEPPPAPPDFVAPPRQATVALGSVPPVPPEPPALQAVHVPPPVGFTGVHKAGSKEPSATVAAAPKSLAAGVQGESTQGRVKHIYFDFDQTISKIHVFKQLAGWEPGISPPHALSERGQIHRLKMLNTEQYTCQGTGHVVPCAAGAPGASWTACALGGPWQDSRGSEKNARG